jgi:hypothetical protein
MNKRIALLFIVFVVVAAASFYFLQLHPRHGHGTEETEYIWPCRANLKGMQVVKEQWATDEHKTTNNTPTWEDVVGKTRYLSVRLECRRGGTYTWGRVGEPVSCSVPGHTLK